MRKNVEAAQAAEQLRRSQQQVRRHQSQLAKQRAAMEAQRSHQKALRAQLAEEQRARQEQTAKIGLLGAQLQVIQIHQMRAGVQ